MTTQELQQNKEMWCSALVGYIYTNMNYLSKDTPWDILAPKHFSSHYKTLIFINCELSKDEKIKFT